MIADVDDDGSGSIEFEEFLKMMTQKILNRDPKDEILKAFRLFDDDETGSCVRLLLLSCVGYSSFRDWIKSRFVKQAKFPSRT